MASAKTKRLTTARPSIGSRQAASVAGAHQPPHEPCGEERPADERGEARHERRQADRELEVEQRERQRRKRERDERGREHHDHRGERRVEADEERDRDVRDDRRRRRHQDQRLAQAGGKAEARAGVVIAQTRSGETPRMKTTSASHEPRPAAHSRPSPTSRAGPARAPAESRASERAAASPARQAAARGSRRARRAAMNFVAWRPTNASGRKGSARCARRLREEEACTPRSYMALNRCANVRLTASVSSRPLSTITGSPRQSRSTRAIARRFTIALRWICQNASGSSSS